MSFWPLLQLALPGPRWLVWWARGKCETPKHHQGIMRHWGCQLRRTLGQLRSQLRSYGGAVGRGRLPVGYFGALTKFVSGKGWMSGFLSSDRALAVAPVNRKPQNRTFHHNSIFDLSLRLSSCLFSASSIVLFPSHCPQGSLIHDDDEDDEWLMGIASSLFGREK